MRNFPRLLLWTAAALVLLVLIGFAAGSFWVKSFLRGPQFQQLVAEKTGQALKGEAIYTPFSWEGSTVFSDELILMGNGEGAIKKLQANLIRADVNWRAIFDGAWRIDRITGTTLQLTIGSPGAKQPADAAALPPMQPSGLQKWLPQRFELGQASFAQAGLEFLDSTGLLTANIKDTRLNFHPEGTGWIIEGERGTLLFPGQPMASIDSFRSRIQGDSVYLTDAQLRLGETGKISASGEFADQSKLQLGWQQIDVSLFLPEEWKSRLSGQSAGTADLSWPKAGLSKANISGRWALSDGLLQDLPILDQIATFTGAPQFRRMPIQNASVDYTWKEGVLNLSNIVIESKGLMKVQGTCKIKPDGKLRGDLRVGVTPQTLQWLPGTRERVFTVAQDGYLWTDVRVSGTAQNMQEDLSSRIVNAMRNEVIDQGGAILNNLPGPAKDGAQQALDLLKPLLR